MGWFFVFGLFLNSMEPALAESETRYWLGTFVKKQLAADSFFWGETQLRYDPHSASMQQIIARGGGLLAFHEHHEAGMLLAYAQTGPTQEYRPTLQYLVKSNLGPFYFINRNRFEYRSFRGEARSAFRVRPMVRVDLPIGNEWNIFVWDEFFVNTSHESWNGDRTVDRNRFFLGFKKTFPQMALELGYLHQYVPRATGTVVEHVLTSYFYF